jgi:hypothetical protein
MIVDQMKDYGQMSEQMKNIQTRTQQALAERREATDE